MTEPHAEPIEVPNQAYDNTQQAMLGPKFVRQLGLFSVCLLIMAFILLIAGWIAKNQSDSVGHAQLALIDLVEGRIQQELTTLNRQNLEALQPQSLKALLSLGQLVNQQNQQFQWFGALHSQTLQVLLTQALENLSRPVAGINSSTNLLQQQEMQLRLDTLPKLTQLKTHILQASNGYLVLLFGMAMLLTFIGTLLGLHWIIHQKTQALHRRIQILNRAMYSQHDNEQKREGAHAAIQGVLSALNHSQSLKEPNQNSQDILRFAKSFHQLSTQGTAIAKSTLNNEQRNIKAESHIEIMQSQLEGLRSDIRGAAQGLRKAGEVSRQLLGRLDASQMELTLNEPENNRQLQQLVELGQQALKESIEGLVLASQKINMGQHESNKLAKYMAVNQTAWSNLLSQIEQVTESASNDSENALRLAKRLMDKSQQPLLAFENNQAAKAPVQLLP